MPTEDGLVITGANGLLGRALMSQLNDRTDVFGVFRSLPRETVPTAVTPIVHDLSEPFGSTLPAGVETIVHLAQSPHYRDFPERADDVFNVNVGSTQRLLDWATRNGVKRFVFASTGGVYSGGQKPCDESAPMKTGFELGHYAASKLSGELLAQSYGHQMIIVILRFFFIYGPRQKRTMLIPRLVESVLNDRPIILQGDEGICINPIYADDAARAVRKAAQLNENHVINIAGPNVLSLKTIGTLIGETTQKHPRFEYQAQTKPNHLIADIGRMTRLLGSPTTAFSDGLHSMVDAQRDSARQGG